MNEKQKEIVEFYYRLINTDPKAVEKYSNVNVYHSSPSNFIELLLNLRIAMKNKDENKSWTLLKEIEESNDILEPKYYYEIKDTLTLLLPVLTEMELNVLLEEID